MNRKNALHRFSLIFEILESEEFQRKNAAEVSAGTLLRSPAESRAHGERSKSSSFSGESSFVPSLVQTQGQETGGWGSRLELQLRRFGGAGAGLPERRGR